MIDRIEFKVGYKTDLRIALDIFGKLHALKLLAQTE